MASLLVRHLFVLNFVSTIIATTVIEVWYNTSKDLFNLTSPHTVKYNIASNQIQPPLVTLNVHCFQKTPGKCNMSHKVWTVSRICHHFHTSPSVTTWLSRAYKKTRPTPVPAWPLSRRELTLHWTAARLLRSCCQRPTTRTFCSASLIHIRQREQRIDEAFADPIDPLLVLKSSPFKAQWKLYITSARKLRNAVVTLVFITTLVKKKLS